MVKLKLNTIIAVTALIVAVFGSTPLGQAAGRMIVPKGSVGTVQLKKDAVTGLKVKNGSLMAADFKAGQLPAGAQGEKGDQGTQGAQGPKGDTGAAGAPGATGISGYEIVQSSSSSIAVGATVSKTVNCPSGKKVVGGGYSSGAFLETASSLPNADSSWHVGVRNADSHSDQVSVFAVCAKVG